MTGDSLNPLDFASRISHDGGSNKGSIRGMVPSPSTRRLRKHVAIGFGVILGAAACVWALLPSSGSVAPEASAPKIDSSTNEASTGGVVSARGVGCGAAGLTGSTIDPSIANTAYQAVGLVNGQVVVGRIDRSDDPWILLTDDYTLKARSGTDGQAVDSPLTRRVDEPHRPDRMAINPAQILFIEPVSPGSIVSRRIDDLKKARGMPLLSVPSSPGRPGSVPPK